MIPHCRHVCHYWPKIAINLTVFSAQNFIYLVPKRHQLQPQNCKLNTDVTQLPFCPCTLQKKHNCLNQGRTLSTDTLPYGISDSWIKWQVSLPPHNFARKLYCCRILVTMSFGWTPLKLVWWFKSRKGRHKVIIIIWQAYIFLWKKKVS
jgi:hypothetical protein